MSYLDRDTYGIYRSDDDTSGPGPRLMGADTLIGEDVYNRQDPFNIDPGQHAETLRANFLGYDMADGKADWTEENAARWVARMSTGNYLIVDTSKPCTFGKPSYLDLEREQMFGTPHTTCGGRTPPEDALDVTYNLLLRGKPEKAADIGDGVDELQKPATTTFPYLAAAD